jgi:hypothetical protein
MTIRLQIIRWMLVATACFGMLAGAFADTPAGAKSDAIQLEVPALPGFSQYADLLTHPAYLALALENNGIVPSFSSRLTLPNSRSVKLRNAMLRYTGRQGTVYTYEAGYTVDLAVSTTELTFPLTVDIATLPQGKVVVKATPPLAKFFPKELVERIRIKASMLSDRATEQIVLDYLDRLSAGAASPQLGDSLVEAILIDAYNKSGKRAGADQRERDVGDAEPLSDQFLLIATLAIWLVLVPVVLVVQRIRRRRMHPA